MRVQHNIRAMNAGRQLKITEGALAKSSRNLSSGYRINMAADDAAGLSISEKMRRQVRGLTQGVQNTEDGVSLCQVADGALAEVHDMLQRINELAVKAANGTNSENDRRCINDEVEQLLTEIDRVGDTTKFNEIFIFRGTEKKTRTKMVLEGGGSVGIAKPSYVPAPTFDKVSMDCELTQGPFRPGSNGNELQLGVRSLQEGVNKTWNLIYGNGSTSFPKITGQYTTAATTIAFTIDLREREAAEYTAEQKDSGEKEWSRTFKYNGGNGLAMEIKQTVTLGAKTEADTSQYYTVSYNIVNTSTVAGSSVKYNLVHHEDTAYNNNDRDESYHAGGGGDRIGQSTIYTTANNIHGINTSSISSGTLKTAVPDDFTIILNSGGKPMALSFTENIKINDGAAGSVKADTLIVGNYSALGQMDGYTTDNMAGFLGQSTLGEDLGFSLVWSGKTLAAGASSATFSFKQGIVKTENDANIPADVEQIPTVDVSPSAGLKPIEVKKDYIGGERQLWIQSGCDAGDGIIMRVSAMNTGVLDIDDLSTLTEKMSDDAIYRISKAIEEISRQRSLFGAYQNRLEHTIANENNIIENTTAAESQIRDTDMASEMVRYSNKNIIMQAGQSMLAQANQSNQGVMSLIAS